ncbi:hypothetical protein ACE38V_01095 [Cytobacillus sp. Hz8]|uniref:hypothetical protein n=1 Tax=Cytobacillus sp. Hz8 TaxID=3347168 RepID=UPI0035D66664
MAVFIRYQLKSYIRSLKFIPPVTVFLGWVFILYAYKNVPILSSYAVSSIALYLTMAWIAMTIFTLEEESEKHILFLQLGSKRLFFVGKWLACFIVAFPLFLFAEFYSIVMRNFHGSLSGIHYGLSIYSHWMLAIFGIMVGTLFSATRFALKKYAWLGAVLVLVISLAYESLAEFGVWAKVVLWVFPPVLFVISYLSGGDTVSLGGHFWWDQAIVVGYGLIGGVLLVWLFLRKER